MENKKINKFAIYIGYVLVLIGSFFGGLYITKLFFLIPWVFFVFDCSWYSRDDNGICTWQSVTEKSC